MSQDCQSQTSVAPECVQSSIFPDVNVTTSNVALCVTWLAAVFNALVIFCAFRIFHRNGVYTHILIVMMSLGDLLLTVYPIPLEALHQIIPSLRSEYFCASVQIAYWLGLAQSGLFLTALNADRFIFFHWPLKYILLTKTYVIAICATIATVIIGPITALWATKSVYIANKCVTTFTNDIPVIAVTASTCVLPIASSFALSVYLFVLTDRRRRRAALAQGTRHGNARRNPNSLLFIFASSTWTLISLQPSRSFITWYYAVHLRENPSSCVDNTLLWLGYASSLLLRANPMVNPVITGLVCAPYRRELTRMFKYVKSLVYHTCVALRRE
ncbi:Protein AEXR-1 [Aphelenchoides avenae]|nr:Protein AEXR-1 [Aphelenchus avenae]